MGRHIIDMTGKTFGKLTVLRFVDSDKRGARWLCKCECGAEKIVLGHRLRKGDLKSCGCGRHQNGRSYDGILISHGGRIMNLRKWSKELGIDYNTLYGRIRRGWMLDDALSIPVWSSQRNARTVEKQDVDSSESV